MIDFNKPIRFIHDKSWARVVGPVQNGGRAIEDSYGIVWIVDQDGRSNESFLIENFTPERKTRWVIVSSEGGYASKEAALRDVEEFQLEHCVVVKVEFEDEGYLEKCYDMEDME